MFLNINSENGNYSIYDYSNLSLHYVLSTLLTQQQQQRRRQKNGIK